MKFTLGEIAKATGGMVHGDPALKCSGVCIDTRKLAKGELFAAIRGAHFDGHDFLGDAHAAGAAALLAGCGVKIPKGAAAVEVQDTVKAMGDIASWWRGRFAVPCVAITGSNGKSTTKEMTSSVAGVLGPVLKTEGNFNNLIGLPLTIFRWNDSSRVAILEMGMNAPGEIRRLTQIARPDVGLITNITAAHLEKLGSVEAVAEAKGELFEAMGESGIAVVNGEDRWAKEMAAKHRGKKIVFGMQNGSDVQFLHMDMEGLDSMDLSIAVMGKEYRLALPVPGAHNVMNALAAVAAGLALGIDPAKAVERIEGFRPMAMRMERIQLANGVRVVNDSYNANPESMRAAFRTVGSAKRAGRFIAALGDMLELGEASSELHKQVGEAAASMGVERLYVMGDFASDTASGAISGGLDDSDIVVCDGGTGQVARLLEEEVRAGDVLLVKGSRGMKMERVVEHLKENIGMG
ncbi:MAG: UDP-N-acetylmuramoyl-tripeptide--D-alanyl-D-alanine ligase [Pseudomonadota bacterium]